MDILLSPSQNKSCPSCCNSAINQIELLPLNIAILDETARMRAQDNEVLCQNGEVTSLVANAPSNSVMNEDGTKKRSTSKASVCYRTGRWNAEESAYTHSLIKCFEMGMLPLPHGIKLNDFLCDLLSCRTSRLTKKLKHAKLGSRTYRGGIMDKSMSNMSSVLIHGGGVQRAQTLFLKTITPEWVRLEMQFNISRMWRTHLANFCIQIGTNLETKEWFSSLDAADYMTMSNEDSGIQEKRKRMRMALCADANVAVSNTQYGKDDDIVSANNINADNTNQTEQDGVFVAGFNVRKMSGINLKAMADGDSDGALHVDDSDTNRSMQPRAVDLKTTRERDSSFSFEPYQVGEPSTMKHSASLGSIAELLSPDLLVGRRDSVYSVDESLCVIDDAIDAVLESSKQEYKGKFLEAISNFLSESNAPFQHADLWVPMDVGGSASVTATSSSKVNGVIYGSQQKPTIRLSNAGFITTRSNEMVVHRLNEVRSYRSVTFTCNSHILLTFL